MLQCVATVSTEQPERYIKQLVGHLGHKWTTAVADDGTGTLSSAVGRCTLTPEPGAVRLLATAPDGESLDRVRDVVKRHLERFGARQGLQVNWSDPA